MTANAQFNGVVTASHGIGGTIERFQKSRYAEGRRCACK